VILSSFYSGEIDATRPTTTSPPTTTTTTTTTATPPTSSKPTPDQLASFMSRWETYRATKKKQFGFRAHQLHLLLRNGRPTKYKKALICYCYKCGSTTLFDYLHDGIFGKSAPPMDRSLNGTFVGVGPKKISRMLANKREVFSFALIRDPIQRLLSAWKDQFTCDSKWSPGYISKKNLDRLMASLYLASIAGMSLDRVKVRVVDGRLRSCMELDDFLEALTLLPPIAEVGLVNLHFTPQHETCFRNSEPKDWGVVAKIGDAGLNDTLSDAMGFGWKATVPHSRSSTGEVLVLTKKQQRMLEKLTEEDYDVLKGFL
jgi:hypothetical protein